MSQKTGAVKRAKQSEVRPHQLGQEVFKTILSEDVDWEPFPAFPPAVRLLPVVVGQPSERGPSPWQHAPSRLGRIRRVRHTSIGDGPLGLEYLSAKDDPRNHSDRRNSATWQVVHSDFAKGFGFLSNGRLKMNDQQKTQQYSGVRDQEIRAALDQHWAASDANDFETEHRIYLEDAVLEYPQSGERTRGRSNIQSQRASQPNKKRFSIRRIIGSGELWVTEFILTYDDKPSYTVSIMEFKGDKVARETQYFADPFVAPAFRAQWVERMDASS